MAFNISLSNIHFPLYPNYSECSQLLKHFFSRSLHVQELWEHFLSKLVASTTSAWQPKGSLLDSPRQVWEHKLRMQHVSKREHNGKVKDIENP